MVAEINKSEKITLRDLIKTIVVSVVIAGIFLMFFRIATVQGNSMDKTLADGDKLLLNTTLYKMEKPKYKDIVVIKRDDLPVKFIVKRVIGIEGDKVRIKDNKLYINEELIQEDYINEEMKTDNLELTVTEGKVFVMGDNRNYSTDSRSKQVGVIDCKSEIYGKVIFV
ncbi:signal peptidase I [Clostridium beijerinckii]|uniref:Signal peptidase I n=1 Tax=Clostridium beijerinckii TaxID=1520 RepID=A0AAW3W2T1_CLOBE|nr:signal peptidase I [Clostridium beijerinckii]MBC2455645.1 signal peptidase I [Clostridium beijerinckii]MBC2473122.1 signal peptidase I [Clostridium beijerinckii]NOV62374.1 signal peptidase I [Clostridium beijerinckii]NOV68129.1 signal peptidase I [Clostridium beijerinckii]NOW30426.1 signal peptidase I [Clostridium beijerinckii]